MKIEFSSQGREMILLLTTNMAAMMYMCKPAIIVDMTYVFIPYCHM